MSEPMIARLGDQWMGAVAHEGHVITAIECWEPRVVKMGDEWRRDSGRVRCDCGDEWNTAIFPPAPGNHYKIAHNTALCEQAGESRPYEVWGQTLTEVRDAVTCRRCLDWLHA